MSIKKRVWKLGKDGIVEVGAKPLPEVNAPFVQDDTIPPTESHATDERRIFESRSALFRHYKQHGFECTGGDHLTGKACGVYEPKVKDSPEERMRKAEWGMLPIDPDLRADLAEQYRKLKWGMAPVSEKEKEICTREERAFRDYQKRQRA